MTGEQLSISLEDSICNPLGAQTSGGPRMCGSSGKLKCKISILNPHLGSRGKEGDQMPGASNNPTFCSNSNLFQTWEE